MFIEVNFSSFCDRFQAMGRADQFSYDDKMALFDYLEGIEEETGEKIELDVIALCCEYSEYDSLEAFQSERDAEEYPDLEAIEQNTTVIPVQGGGFIIQRF